MVANYTRKIFVLAMLFSMGCRTSEKMSQTTTTPLIDSKQIQTIGTMKIASTNIVKPQTSESVSSLPEIMEASFHENIAIVEKPVSQASKSDEPETITNIEPATEQNRNVSYETPATGAFRLSLAEAIRLSMEKNPDLQAVRSSEPVAIAAIKVAETYPFNPQFQTQILPYSRDQNGNDGSVSQQHVVVQTFELGGQQQHREGVASANWRQVHRTVDQAELMNSAATTRLFFAALYQRELRDLSQKTVNLNDQVVGVTERRQQAGQANIAEVELARLQLQASHRQLRLAEASFQTALMALRNQLNFKDTVPFELDGEWALWHWKSFEYVLRKSRCSNMTECKLSETSPVFDDYELRQLIMNRPDVAAARAAVAMAAENLQLADAMRRPNLQAGPMYQRDDSATQFWGIQAQIDIPIVNSGKPLVRQRYAELHQQQITAEQLENRAVLEARAAIQRYERARKLTEFSRVDFDRDVSASLKPFEDQFKAGQINLLQVFAARATIVQSRQSFFDLLNELALATSDVTQATGIPPQQLFTEKLLPPAPVETILPDEISQ